MILKAAKSLHLPGILCVALGMILTGGCSMLHLPTVMDAVKAGKISGLPSSPSIRGMQIFPEFADKKRFTQVQLLQNVWIGEAGEDAKMGEDAQLCSFVLGRRVSDGAWEIISAATRAKDGVWHELEVQPNTVLRSLP